MARIPEHIIEQVREANDVYDVVSEYVQLKRSGTNYFGRCPFHDEKTASFSVSTQKQIYHCFGCGKGGSVINFMMEIENLDFISSVRNLAERANITIEESAPRAANDDQNAQLYNLHELAARVFQRILLDKEGENALAYFRQRKLSEESIKQFKLGYAPNRWDTFTTEAMKLGLPRNILEMSGLISVNQQGNLYDRFRSRLMVPIYNLNNRVTAFGGRIFEEEDNAKYMNSPETPIYHKSNILYGLHLSKEAMRKKKTAIVMEGYFDMMRVFQEGFHYGVAGSGTAFTLQQAKLLKRFSDKAILCYDSDNAGRVAAEKAGRLLLNEGLDVKIMVLENGEDPDSFFDHHDAEAFQRKIDSSVDYMDYVLSWRGDTLKSINGKNTFINSFLDDLSQLDNSIIRELLAQQLAEGLGLDASNIKTVLQQKVAPQERREFFRDQRSQHQAEAQIEQPKGIHEKQEKAELSLLRLHLSNENDGKDESFDVKEYLEWLLDSLDDEFIKILKYKELFQFIRGRLRKKEFPINPRRLMDELQNQTFVNIVSGLYANSGAIPASVQEATDCIIAIKQIKQKTRLNELRSRLRLPETDEKVMMSILNEMKEIQDNPILTI
jgi:DNA primase